MALTLDQIKGYYGSDLAGDSEERKFAQLKVNTFFTVVNDWLDALQSADPQRIVRATLLLNHDMVRNPVWANSNGALMATLNLSLSHWLAEKQRGNNPDLKSLAVRDLARTLAMAVDGPLTLMKMDAAGV